MQPLPLFPLSAVLFPAARMSLRVFEPRYVDLVRDCLRDDTEFGVVWIREGREVTVPGAGMPKLAQLGTTARIVDWDALPAGRLGVTIEGVTKFRLLSTTQRPNFLVVGEIEPLAADATIALPKHADELVQILQQLVRHPSVARLNVSIDALDCSRLTNLVAQLLPIPGANKFNLLAELDPRRRLELLQAFLGEFVE